MSNSFFLPFYRIFYSHADRLNYPLSPAPLSCPLRLCHSLSVCMCCLYYICWCCRFFFFFFFFFFLYVSLCASHALRQVHIMQVQRIWFSLLFLSLFLSLSPSLFLLSFVWAVFCCYSIKFFYFSFICFFLKTNVWENWPQGPGWDFGQLCYLRLSCSLPLSISLFICFGQVLKRNPETQLRHASAWNLLYVSHRYGSLLLLYTKSCYQYIYTYRHLCQIVQLGNICNI